MLGLDDVVFKMRAAWLAEELLGWQKSCWFDREETNEAEGVMEGALQFLALQSSSHCAQGMWGCHEECRVSDIWDV